ncbi:MAG: nucleotide sugar dehydrogenase [Methanobacterium sp.]|nr:nucleotide sugar dehydrogenase [Methanobacterium sp.]MBV1756063.1 nucleotide sugar dehydrogenase [Methanobacterium sp.]
MEESMLKKVENKKARICIVGLGYVGLPTAIFFAEEGYEVIGVDKNQEKVRLTNQGISTIGELNLDDRLKKVVDNHKLHATTDTVQASGDADIIILIVPTPVTPSKDPDLSYIISAGEEVAQGLNSGKLVILESTVYPGVTEETLQPLLEAGGLKAGDDFGLSYCPERYNPGDSEHDIQHVSRVLGAINDYWGQVTQKLYQSIIQQDVKILSNIKTAEAAKVIENTQRDLNIALMNELAMIFERLDIDIMEVIEGASTKWNFNKYYPGAGVGGHCLPVDPYYLVKKAQEVGYHSKVIAAGRTINDHMPTHLYHLTADALNDHERAVNNSKIVILGLSYKENVGDPRESPANQLIHKLQSKNARVSVVDPYISEDYQEGMEKNLYTALEDAHALVLVTAHDDFKNLDWERIKKLMKLPICIDGRRIYDPVEVKSHGFCYRGVGAVNH